MTIKLLPYVSVLPGVCVISLVPSLVSIILDSNKRHTVLFLCFVMKSGYNTKSPKEKYTTGAEETRSSTTVRGRIRCHEGVGILC